MSYHLHKKNLHESLKEFERLTGSGNMKTANLSMVKLIRSLVEMLDVLAVPKEENTIVKSCKCNGNCICSTNTVDDVTATTNLETPLTEESSLLQEEPNLVESQIIESEINAEIITDSKDVTVEDITVTPEVDTNSNDLLDDDVTVAKSTVKRNRRSTTLTPKEV